MLKRTKDVIALLTGILAIWAVVKTANWWRGLEAWQAVLVAATTYLIWWIIDHYYNLICKQMDAVRDSQRELADRIAIEERERQNHVNRGFQEIRERIEKVEKGR